MDFMDARWVGQHNAELPRAAVRFGPTGTLYPFTTENLGGYLPFVVKRDARVLAVAGSGDHLLNAVFYGAKHVTIFDCNLWALYWCELKCAAVKLLPYEEFLKFFLYGRSNEPLAHATFQLLRAELRPEARAFFDGQYATFGESGERLRGSPLFKHTYYSDSAAISNNPYLASQGSYVTVQHALAGVDVMGWQAGIMELSGKLGLAGYDLVLLSNISDYLRGLRVTNGAGDEDDLESFVTYGVQPLVRSLDSGGMCCAAYVYAAESGDPRTAIDDPAIRRSAFRALRTTVSELTFPSVIDGKRDLVVVVAS